MTPSQAIEKAKLTLLEDRYLYAHLTRNGSIRIPVIDLTAQVSPPASEGPPLAGPSHIVTFTIEESALFGRRLLAEYRGYKEFAG